MSRWLVEILSSIAELNEEYTKQEEYVFILEDSLWRRFGKDAHALLR